MASMAKKILLPSSVAIVETMAADKALTFAQDIGLSSLILQGDLEMVFNALKSEDVSLAFYSHLIDVAKCLVENFIIAHFFYIKK